ncbi:hypothetical protein TorRG33x02_023440, partial [Trema orientale]
NKLVTSEDILGSGNRALLSWLVSNNSPPKASSASID